eukprot:6208333-Pleurochrysis_carterae.AAC.5
MVLDPQECMEYCVKPSKQMDSGGPTDYIAHLLIVRNTIAYSICNAYDNICNRDFRSYSGLLRATKTTVVRTGGSSRPASECGDAISTPSTLPPKCDKEKRVGQERVQRRGRQQNPTQTAALSTPLHKPAVQVSQDKRGR